MNPLSVHEVIRQSKERGPLFVEVEGFLCLEFECVCLSHWPKAEQTGDYGDCIWIWAERLFEFDDRLLARCAGRRVIVFGEVDCSPLPEGQCGYGHLGMFAGEIKARRIERWKDRERQCRFDEG